MYFKKIVGHKDLKDRIKKALREDQLAHAYIFEGVKGVGKALMAESIAAALLCENEVDEACGVCAACQKMATSNHPDYEITLPDGASIKNKQIEGFQEFILLKPYTGNRKIAIIKDAHTMTLSAQNRILKILEEPPHYAVIIFITDQMAGMLPTIKSRCQSVSFQRLKKDQIVDYLLNNHEIDSEKAHMYATFADGSILRAENSLTDEAFVELRENVIQFADNLIMKKRAKAFDWTGEMEGQKDKLEMVFDLLKLWFRDIMLIKSGSAKELLLNADQFELLQKESYRVSLKQSVEILERIEQARAQLASHVNVGLILETLIMDIQEGT